LELYLQHKVSVSSLEADWDEVHELLLFTLISYTVFKVLDDLIFESFVTDLREVVLIKDSLIDYLFTALERIRAEDLNLDLVA
jgi:hypothetical protein